MSKGKIYRATNVVNGKIYIGKTVKSLKRRITEHFCFKIAKTHFQRAILKYGKEKFKWDIICECNKEELNDKEKYFINQYASSNRRNGYNLTYGGDGFSIGDLNPAKLEKNKEIYRKNWLGKKHSKKTKLKISKTLKERKLTDEHRKNISKSQFGRKIPQGENSKLSKKFIIIFPNGNKKKIKGLRKFCRDFNLNVKLMRRVADNKQDNHKGYKCKRT